MILDYLQREQFKRLRETATGWRDFKNKWDGKIPSARSAKYQEYVQEASKVSDEIQVVFNRVQTERIVVCLCCGQHKLRSEVLNFDITEEGAYECIKEEECLPY